MRDSPVESEEEKEDNEEVDENSFDGKIFNKETFS